MRRACLGLGALLLACTRPQAPPAAHVLAAAPAPARADADRDGDGIDDSVDRCRDDPGALPDGCPILDSDGDGLLDPDDRCVASPETLNGFADQDGCPDVLPPEGCSRVDGSPPSPEFGPAPAPGAGQRPLLAALPDVPRLVDAGVTVLPNARDARGFIPATDPRIRVPLSADDTGLRNLERLVAAGGFADDERVDPAEFVQIAGVVEPLGPDWQLSVELGPCPWQPRHRLARVRVQAPPPGAAARQIAVAVETGAATAAAWPSIHAALVALVDTLGPADRVALLTHGADTRILVPATNDRAALRAGLASLAVPSLAPAGPGRVAALAAGVFDPRLPGARHVVVLGRTAPSDLAALRTAATVHTVVLDEPAGSADLPAGRVIRAVTFPDLRRALVDATRPRTPARPLALEVVPVPGALRSLRWIGGDEPRVLCDGPRIAPDLDLAPGEVVTVLLELDPVGARGPLATLALRSGDDPPVRRVDLVDGPDVAASLAMQVARIAAELALLTRRDEPWPALPAALTARGGRRLAALEREAAALVAGDPSGAAARLHAVLVGLRRAAPAARRHAVAVREHFAGRADDEASYRAEVRAYAAAEQAARARPAAYFDQATRLSAVGTLSADTFVRLSHHMPPGLRWELVAHCDDRELADPAACAALAARRGEVVRERLVARGVSPAILGVRPARADERDPPAMNARERARQRRVDFVLLVQ